MLGITAVTELFLCWIAWSLAFIRPSREAAGRTEVARARSSQWGIGLVMAGFAFTWAYVRPVGFHKSYISLVLSMILGPPSVALAWMATRHLGKQWRYQAALRADHELIRTGPYAWIRHPIYTSMLGMVLATGFCWTWWPLFVTGLICFIAGTEIRVRAEDRLLAERFQEEFEAYRKRVPAYLPLMR
ncbi:MAG TPA: isoprenylcysteine carboxylmethyltransferase family protein [Acidobacteriaceae bacterium]|nr:isoprenylcysteine carboxylmethyltransferase family protein [Acidobacteriaceae bacterium]